MKTKKSKGTCTDRKCPFHGDIRTKREEYTGKVIRKDSSRSATIEWSRQNYIQKYERYEQRRSRLRVHNPDCIGAEVGDVVRVMKTRPLSKTKHFVIVEKMEKNESN